MNIDLYLHELGYLIVARNIFGDTCEMVSQPGDGIYEYVLKTGRLNASYIVYWLTEAKKLNKEQAALLSFLNTANDGRSKRRVRAKGWEAQAGLSTGEVPHRPLRPGDVVVHGDVAQVGMKGT